MLSAALTVAQNGCLPGAQQSYLCTCSLRRKSIKRWGCFRIISGRRCAPWIFTPGCKRTPSRGKPGRGWESDNYQGSGSPILQLMVRFNVAPIYQRLYFNGVELANSEATMEELRIPKEAFVALFAFDEKDGGFEDSGGELSL
ncbi:hypothetical protein M427DRAFT_137261 [Gonapodya prolifera JEL478]|uniref:Uncharacterized protein n=1 Tax=Gonapodya prolifera (strain JEL478) TaxID=1344416 RepID=A0A139A7C4_GONPJ|nr:hypothetical protein M427DRAFT_137261 [Gonapodya prolifera JEL478]|eukprot:KXS12568.1 hypothetical protein M427DRAFT_137261 [Gonapodya prolifera JEL478]